MNQKAIENELTNILNTLKKKLSIEMIKKKTGGVDVIMEEEMEKEYQS